MSDILGKSLTAGAYVIRNKQTSTVLHVRYPDTNNNSVLASDHDESEYRDQQIWWIEPLAHYIPDTEEHDKGMVYSITIPGTGKSLDANPSTGYVYSEEHHAAPWQRWRLREVISDNDDGEVYYNLVNAFTSKVIDIKGDNPSSGEYVQMKDFIRGQDRQCWQLVVPVVTKCYRPGWIHIQNVATGDLLRHNYNHNVPICMPPPSTAIESQYRENWDFQWTLVNAKIYGLGNKNSWVIINRLTRTRLMPHLLKMTVADFSNYEKQMTWRLEPDQSLNWKVTSSLTGFFLELSDTSRGGGKEVICDQKRFDRHGGRQSWILRAPLLYSADAPPDYHSQKS